MFVVYVSSPFSLCCVSDGIYLRWGEQGWPGQFQFQHCHNGITFLKGGEAFYCSVLQGSAGGAVGTGGVTRENSRLKENNDKFFTNDTSIQVEWWYGSNGWDGNGGSEGKSWGGGGGGGWRRTTDHDFLLNLGTVFQRATTTQHQSNNGVCVAWMMVQFFVCLIRKRVWGWPEGQGWFPGVPQGSICNQKTEDICRVHC